MLTYALLITGFAFLIKGADLLVEGASSVARRLRIPDLVVGLTIVSFGTSVAELFVNVSASMNHNSGIVIGNILGSNIFNAAFILGVSAVIFPLTVKESTVWKEIPLSVLAAVAFFIVANDQIIDRSSVSMLSRIDGMILLLFFVIFMHYTISLAQEHRSLFEQEVVYQDSLLKAVGCICVGLLGVIFGGQWVVSGAVRLAAQLNVSDSLIGLTIVAAGTSLPELAASSVAAYKKKSDIAVANVVGSNIFNIFFILGISSLINPVAYDLKQNVDAVVSIIVSLLIFLCMFSFGKNCFDRKEGILLIVFYLIYLSLTVMKG